MDGRGAVVQEKDSKVEGNGAVVQEVDGNSALVQEIQSVVGGVDVVVQEKQTDVDCAVVAVVQEIECNSDVCGMEIDGA